MNIKKYYPTISLFLPILYIFWFIILKISCTSTLGKGKACKQENIYQYAKNYSTPDLIFYGLTSDCQIFFTTLVNIDKINDLKVDHKHQHCSPYYTKLHIVNYLGQLSILVTTLRHGNNFCTMNIEFPAVEFYTSPILFTYSLMSSLPFFACSSLPLDSGFLLQPSQSYIDPRISDVIHFIGKNTTSKEIIELQFKITPEGYLVRHKQTHATDIFGKRQQRVLVTVDRRTGLLYHIGDAESINLYGTCSLDPQTLPIGQHHLENNIYSLADKYSKVDSLSVDEKTIMLGIQKSRDIQKTRLLIGHLKERINFKCFISLPYLAHVGMISKRTIDKLNDGHILTLEMELKEKQKELELRIEEEKYRDLNNTVKVKTLYLPNKEKNIDNKKIRIENNDKKMFQTTTSFTPSSITTKMTPKIKMTTNEYNKESLINDKEEDGEEDLTLKMEKNLHNNIKLMEKNNDELKDLFYEKESKDNMIPEFDFTNETNSNDNNVEYFTKDDEEKESYSLPTDSSNLLDVSISNDGNNNKDPYYSEITDISFVNTSKKNSSLISNKSSSLSLLVYVKNHFISFFITVSIIILTVSFTIM
ncbi:Hypothetical protein SRAE_X000102200 [Strongyloides ratti]|uniref:Uncharacterized protein n=1 Tax=Strongyloides ratti TaxID=34506 RepID=A0A090MMN4_STRRB|nr:Hypothetical protein SRAE_X000102200 [Strongyloides ratti]CEF59271.1 Hypothetical protein SRAE_X000102200 [Strongyloides ratti]